MKVVFQYPWGALQSFRAKSKLKDNLGALVAPHMDGTGYDDEPLNLTGSDIDVLLSHYRREDAKFASPFWVYVMDQAYPGRMAFLEQRLEDIARDVASFLTEQLNVDPQSYRTRPADPPQGLVKVVFFPLQPEWVVSSQI